MDCILKCFIVLLLCGVFGDPDEVKSVFEGDPVTLQTGAKIQSGDKILWRFGEEGSANLLVQMHGNRISYKDSIDVRFKDRLLISNTQTGDLTINNMRIKYSGLYTAEIQAGSGSSFKKFRVTVKESPRVTDAEASDVKSLSVMEGKSVTLHTDVQTQKGDLIQWRFGDKNLLIAKGDMEDNKISYIDDDDRRFSGRLKLNDQTGDLTITNIINSNTGVYNLKIISSRETKYKTFSVSLSEAGWSLTVVVGLCLSVVFAVVIIIVGLVIHLSKNQTVQDLFVEEGESVTLHTADIKGFRFGDAVIEWKYRDEGIIAEINTKDNTFATYNGDDERFKGRLELNNETGDLTISDLKTKHSGLYKLNVSTSIGTSRPFTRISSSCQFNVIVTDRIKPVKYGDLVTLLTGFTDLQKDDLILWMCGAEDTRIAKFTVGTEPPLFYGYTDDIFNNKLQINLQTGDLTIKDITPKHCGLYRVLICSDKRSTYRRFKVSILVQAEKGGSVGLKTGAQIQSGDRVEWSFRDPPSKRTSYDKITLVTGVNGDENKTKYPNKRFKGRLKMNAQTGDLNITNIRETDEGVYTLQQYSTEGKITNWVFSVVFVSAINEPTAGMALLTV